MLDTANCSAAIRGPFVRSCNSDLVPGRRASAAQAARQSRARLKVGAAIPGPAGKPDTTREEGAI